MKRLFVVASIYQLFNAINITDYENMYSNTTLVLLHTKGCFIERINTEYLRNLFENVYVVNYNTQNNKMTKFIYVIKESFRKKIFGVMIEKQFDEIYITGTEIYSKLVACKLMKKDTKLCYYEDGLGSYYSVLDQKTKKKKDLILNFRFRIDPLKQCERLYVYEPNCVCNNTYKIETLSLPKLINRTLKNIDLNKVCRDKLMKFDKRVIFLNAWFENDAYYELQNKLTDLMVQYMGNEQCCIKVHPNELKTIKYKKNISYVGEKSSFEMSNYYTDFSNCIFISAVSTASFSPKLVYGQEPYIIYLYKIFQNEFGLWTNIDSAIKKMSESYSEKKKIIIPESVEEYKIILKHLQKEFRNEGEFVQYSN